MNKKLLYVFMAVGVFIYSCGNNSNEKTAGNETAETQESTKPEHSTDEKGIGKFKDVELTHPLDQAMVTRGEQLYDVKCGACHKLTDERVVGPGWKGVTDRRKPEWIMNFITNVDEMLERDTASQAMLELCMVRMPNQNLSDEDARAVLEFMRKNDNKN